jgi:hypothetical protein
MSKVLSKVFAIIFLIANVAFVSAEDPIDFIKRLQYVHPEFPNLTLERAIRRSIFSYGEWTDNSYTRVNADGELYKEYKGGIPEVYCTFAYGTLFRNQDWPRDVIDYFDIRPELTNDPRNYLTDAVIIMRYTFDSGTRPLYDVSNITNKNVIIVWDMMVEVSRTREEVSHDHKVYVDMIDYNDFIFYVYNPRARRD